MNSSTTLAKMQQSLKTVAKMPMEPPAAKRNDQSRAVRLWRLNLTSHERGESPANVSAA